MNQNINDFKFCTRCGTRLPKTAVICYKCDTKQNIFPNMQNRGSGVNLSKEENVQDVSFREVNTEGKSAEFGEVAAEKGKIDIMNAGVIVLIGIAVAAASLFAYMIMSFNRDRKFYDEYKAESKTSAVEIINDRDSESDNIIEPSEYDAGWD